MAEEEDQDSKTEEPSQKKLEDTLEKGQVAHSREVNSFLMLLSITLLIIFLAPYTLQSINNTLVFFISNAGSIRIDQGIIEMLFKNLGSKLLFYLFPIFITIICVAIFSSYIQQGEFIFSVEPLKPQLSRLSIFKGFKRLFSLKSFVEFLKSLFKITLVGVFIAIIIMNNIQELNQYQHFPVMNIINQIFTMITKIMIVVCVIMSVIAFFDFLYQRYEHLKSLKMTKHEVKEEYKQMEGSPEIKQKIKSLRAQQAKKNLAATVPKATVIITNPNHYAIGLQYDPEKHSAPIVVAKGLDLIAEKIKEIANDNDIPIVENPPLARSLYKDVEINQQIPLEHYEAVAKIISYVMALDHQRQNRD